VAMLLNVLAMLLVHFMTRGRLVVAPSSDITATKSNRIAATN
jgi:hypothetical protein